MYQSGRTENVCREMLKYGIDILGVTESRWTGSGEQIHSSGVKILFSGHTNEAQGHNQGVALLLTKEASKSLISWLPHGPRIIEAYFKTVNQKISLRLIVVYAPTEDKEDAIKNDFYNQLNRVYRDKHKGSDVTMVIGDMNAKVGSSNENMEEVMGTHGIGSLNDNGDRLISFCMEHGLVIGGTIFPHKKVHTATWKSPDHRTLNQIDHICISKKFRRSLMDVKVQRGADVQSDHYLLTSKVKLKLRSQPKEKNPRIKYNIAALRQQEHLDSFKLELRNRFELLTNPRDQEESTVEDTWVKLKTVYNQTCSEFLGFKKQEQKPWISQETLTMMDERREQRMKTLVNEEERNNYKRLSKAIKKSARRDKIKYTEDLANKAEIAASKNRMKEVYDTTKQLTGRFNKPNKHVRDKQGRLIKN